MRQRPSKNLAARLTALLQATRVMASSLDLEQSLQAIVRQATIISDTNFVRLLLLDEEAQVLRYRAGVGLPPEEERNLVIPVDESFSGQVVATGKPLAIPDMRGDPRLHNPQHAGKYGLLSYLGLPVKVGDRVIGVLVFNTDAPHVYGADEIAYLSAFAEQAAVAIENARLHEATARRGAELEALLRASRSLMSGLDLQGILDRILAEAAEIAGSPHVRVALVDREARVLRVERIKGELVSAGFEYPLEGSLSGLVVTSGEPVFSPDVQTDPRSHFGPRYRDLGIVTYLGLPIKSQGEVVGLLIFNTTEPREYTRETLACLTSFADQAAIAIENARLYDTAQREITERRQAEEALRTRTQQLEAVRAIGEEITRELDLRAVLDLIVRRAVELVGTSSGMLRLWDEEADLLVPQSWVGLDMQRAAVSLRLGEGVAGTAAERRQGLLVNDFRHSPYATPLLLERTTHRAILAEPLLYRDRLIGVINLNREEPGRPFTEDDRQLLALFAAQAVIAIENARLFEATVRRGEQLEALLSSLKTVTSGLNLREILDRILGEAIRISGAVHVKILLLEEATQGLRVALARGGTVQLDFPAPLERSLSGTVAATGQPLFVADSQDESRNPNAAFDRQMGLRTYLGLPVKGRHGVLGVVTFNTTEPRNYSDEELSYLTSFADQAAIAIENARLYEEVRRHAEELETRVRQRTAELEEALRVKVEFLGKMSHELRTPLNFVLGFSDLLQQGTGGPLTPKQTTYLDRIQTGGKRLLSLVSDVLDIAQLDAGKSRLRLEAVILAPLVQEVLGLVQIQVSQKRLKVTTALDPWMPFIVADRFKLAQILHNLVGNAVKFTPEGGSITIRTYQEAEGRKQKADGREQEEESRSPARGGVPSAECRLPSVVIEVEDTGIGIRPENLETVFEAFYQIDGSETRAQGGVGLGLPLVRRLVELHGGRVWAESAGPGQGSRLVVRLPRLEVPKAKRILLVEDEALIRTPMAAALESAGFDVSQAAMGADALAVMEAEAFDLLILDVILPDMEGWEILRRVREVEEVRTLPVLVVTGLKSLNAEQALALGADEFLTKPVSPRVLVDTVVRLLASSAASGAGVGPRSVRTGERPEG